MTNAEIKRKSKSSQSDYMNREWNTQRMPSSAAGGYATGCYIFDQAWCLWRNWTILRVNAAKILQLPPNFLERFVRLLEATLRSPLTFKNNDNTLFDIKKCS